MLRYLRAFVAALKLTLRGETLQSPLDAWIDVALLCLDAVNQAAQQQQIDPSALSLRIDQREISMAVILDTVEHNLKMVYPRLLQTPSSSSLIYASNLDDHYRLTRLETAVPAATPLQDAVKALAAQLEAVPKQE